MDLLIIVHIKSTYDGWKSFFDDNPAGREDFADDSRTRIAKVDDKTAMVQLLMSICKKCLKLLIIQILI